MKRKKERMNMQAIEILQAEIAAAGVRATIRAQANPFTKETNIMVSPALDAPFQDVNDALCAYLGLDATTATGRKILAALDMRYKEISEGA